MEEIWKDVVGYEGLYAVSDKGRIRSLRRDKVLKKKALPNGRERICLRKDGKNTFTFTARVMAIAFIPNPEGKPVVDHINRDHTDNRIENLRWATHPENHANSIAKNTRRHKGVRVGARRFTAYSSIEGKYKHLGTFATFEDAAAAVLKFSKSKYGDFYTS